MPILHTQFRGEGVDQEGLTIQVHPRIALAERGPVLQVTLGIADRIASQLIEQGKAVPTPVSGFGIIDTGASGTCIDDAIAKELNLPAIDLV